MASTLTQLKNLKEPGALSEIYVIPGTDVELSITGIRNRFLIERDVRRPIKALLDCKTIVLDDGTQVEMVELDKVAAGWCAACVTEPIMTAYDWAKWGYENPDRLIAIRDRCLIASRMVSDPEKDVVSDADAAKNEIDEAGASDPLDTQSLASASTNSTDSQGSSTKTDGEPESDTTSPTDQA